MDQTTTQPGSIGSAFTESYNRGTEIGSKLATDVVHSSMDVVSEGVKSLEEIFHEGEQKTVAVSSKIGEVIGESVKSFETTLDECEETVESVCTEGLTKGSEFITAASFKVGEAVEHSVEAVELSINEGSDVCAKVVEISEQVADATVHTVSEGVKTVQSVLKQTEENYPEFKKGMDIATTVGTKAAEIAGEIVGGTVQVAEEMWDLVNEAVTYERAADSLVYKVV